MQYDDLDSFAVGYVYLDDRHAVGYFYLDDKQKGCE